MKRLAALLAAVMLLAGMMPGRTARAEEPAMQIAVAGDIVLPGQAVIVWFMVPEDGVCSITMVDREGNAVSAAAKDRPAVSGYNSLYWNGTWEGVAAPEGEWILRLEMNGRTAETQVRIGRMIPLLMSPVLEEKEVTVGKRAYVSFWATESGEVTLTAGDGRYRTEKVYMVERGENTVSFCAEVPAGICGVELILRRKDGTSSPPVTLSLAVREPDEVFTPIGQGHGEDYALNGWTVPMDLADEDAVWQALTATVTVLDDGKDKAQVRQMVIRKEPDAKSESVGTVTLVSQGVHVLERGAEWTRIECYSSSFHDSPILNWNTLVQGWVETKYLKTVVPNQSMGLVVDKLTQRLYVFREGSLYSTLLVSTGLANAKQPYNETRSGEFLLVSKVGGFNSDNMFCPRALRFNAGDLLHEVPYIEKNGIIDYSMTEPKLGTRASHGCIRVQRKQNPEGLNQGWLYDNYRVNTKILVWEDWQGRQIPVPADGEVFWFSAKRNDYYHGSDNCNLLGTRSPRTITYAELSAEDCRLKACPACGPVMKKGKLLETNAQYAAGGDHDPIMTEARLDCPKKRRGR